MYLVGGRGGGSDGGGSRWPLVERMDWGWRWLAPTAEIFTRKGRLLWWGRAGQAGEKAGK